MGSRHHYVPRFYLKAFASSDKRIHVFHLAQARAIEDASLRDQCYSKRFYGADNSLEEALASVEGAAAKVLNRIITTRAAPSHGGDAHYVLLHFISLQLTRTIAAMANAKAMWLALGKAAFADEPPPDFDLLDEDALAMSMSAARAMADSLHDLGSTIVQARTAPLLVTSDNPVFRYNQYCEGIEFSGVTGTTMAGFQLFYPVAPDLLLLLYDRHAYKVGSRKSSQAVLATPEDVAELNRLQIMSANHALYFSDWSVADDLAAATHALRKQRRRSRPHVNVASPVNGGRSQLLHQYWPMPQLGLRLSFVSTRRNARRIPLLERARLYRSAHAAEKAVSGRPGRSRRFLVEKRYQ